MANDTATETIDLRLTAIRYAAKETHTYEFRRPDGGPLPEADAGSHIDLNLPNGMARQYSLVTVKDSDKAYVVGIRRDRESRGGSIYIHEQLRVGTVLKVGGPRNNFPLDENAPHSVLIAGGIGVTPIHCMAEQLAAQGKSWEMYYSTRTREECAFHDELEALAGGDGKVNFHFDDEAQGKFLDLKAIVAAAPEGSHFYCCGPIPMLTAFEDATKDIPEERVHVEYFSAKEEAATEGGYTVVLQKSGKEFVIPEGKTILEVLREGGIDVTYSCEEGVCGACETAVISGTPDHRDNILTDKEREESKTMMICCSGCKSERLVLDM